MKNKAVDRTIRRWLDQVERRLPGDKAGHAEIIDALREHIATALADRCGDRAPTAEDADEVLSHMDSPTRFGLQEELQWPHPDAEHIVVSRIAMWTLVGSVAVAILGIVLGSVTRVNSSAAIVVAGIGAAAAAVMGFVSWRVPLGRAVAIVSLVLLAAMAALVPVRRVGGPDPGPTVERYESLDDDRGNEGRGDD